MVIANLKFQKIYTTIQYLSNLPVCVSVLQNLIHNPITGPLNTTLLYHHLARTFKKVPQIYIVINNSICKSETRWKFTKDILE